ncbi:right-handed parallel beta-helix repeat-containing protein, partial [bacterium]|nr:right-handed parallel beta-helix repeat-containing protein [bacterium]
MKVIYRTLFVLFFISSVHAIEVEGDVEGEWTTDDSPVIVTDDITVQRNNELIIQPGVEVRFNGAYELRVNGLLTAAGEEENMITFTTNIENRMWRAIRLMEAEDGCEISYCILEHSEQVGRFNDVNSRGGALYAERCDDLVISNNIFRNNTAPGQGSAVSFNHCTGEFTFNHIYDHVGFTLMAVFDYSDMLISDNLVENNTAVHGCSIYVNNASAPVLNNIIRNNRSTEMAWGCGLYFVWGATSRVYNNLVYGNEGGGVFIGYGANIEDFDHNVIFDNPGRCGVILVNNGHVNITNSIIWGHNDPIWIVDSDGSAEYSLIENFDREGLQNGEGMLDEDPQFVDPDNDDFHLAEDSPCIDAGDPDSPEDPDGSRADIGVVFPRPPFELIVEPDSIDFGYLNVSREIIEIIRVIYRSEDEDADDVHLDVEIFGDDNWLDIDPIEADMVLNDMLELELLIIHPHDELGEREAMIIITPNELDILHIEIPVTAILIEGIGQVNGVVTRAANGDVIEGVLIELDRYPFTRLTDENGFYEFDYLPVGQYELTFIAPDYLPATDVIDVDDDENELNISLLHAECTPSEPEFIIRLEAGRETTVDFQVDNGGNGPLSYTVDRRCIGEEDFDPWELRQLIDVEEITGDSYIQGIVYAEGCFFISGSNNGDAVNKIYVFDTEWELLREFDQFDESRYGMRDLAYDGELIWGADGNVLYGFSTNGFLVSTIEGEALSYRSLTWDPVEEIFWSSDITSYIYATDLEGNLVRTVEPPEGLRMYGLAFWRDDPDGYNLYAFSRNDDFDIRVNKINLANGNMIAVTELDIDESVRPAGIQITNQYDVNSWVLVGITQTRDQAAIWQLGVNREWFRIDPTAGVIDAGENEDFQLTLDARLSPVDAVYEGELIFRHDGVGSRTIIPVTLRVIEGGEFAFRTLHLETGWNMVSVNIEPVDADIRYITRELVESAVLEIMKNGYGDFYIPEFDYNNIPGWVVEQGYKMKVTEDVDLTIEGTPVPPDHPIELHERWQIIGYMPRVRVPAPIAFANIEDRLIIAKDMSGDMYIPTWDFCNLPPLHEGGGYQVCVDENCVLVYNVPDDNRDAGCQSLGYLDETTVKPVYLPVLTPTENNMSLLVLGNPPLQSRQGIKGGVNLPPLRRRGGIKGGVVNDHPPLLLQ